MNNKQVAQELIKAAKSLMAAPTNVKFVNLPNVKSGPKIVKEKCEDIVRSMEYILDDMERLDKHPDHVNVMADDVVERCQTLINELNAAINSFKGFVNSTNNVITKLKEAKK